MTPKSRSGPIDVSETRSVNLIDLGDVIHDARLDMDTARVSQGSFQMSGVIELMIGRQVGRYPLTLTIPDAHAWHMTDEAGIGLLEVEDTRTDEGGLTIEGGFPATLRVESPSATATVSVGESPLQIRRWWRWHDVPRQA